MSNIQIQTPQTVHTSYIRQLAIYVTGPEPKPQAPSPHLAGEANLFPGQIQLGESELLDTALELRSVAVTARVVSFCRKIPQKAESPTKSGRKSHVRRRRSAWASLAHFGFTKAAIKVCKGARHRFDLGISNPCGGFGTVSFQEQGDSLSIPCPWRYV